MSNSISATQATQAADEIIRLANIAKTYAGKLNDEQPATDQSPAINAAMKLVAAFQEIAKIATTTRS